MSASSGFPRCFALLGILALLAPRLGGGDPRAQGAIDRVSVDLILVDVEARDAQGRPLRGLKPSDFEVKVNGVRRALYSVDDQCGCADAAPVITRRDEGPAPSTPATPAEPAPPRPAQTPVSGEPIQLVFYFDFGLMDQNGRIFAFNEASRWIRGTMRDGDQIMIVGSSFARGAVTVADMTSDRTKLLAALDAMKVSPDFVDPHMAFLHARIRDCKVEPLPNCNANAITEYEHNKGMLKTLSSFMEKLDAIPGRKHLVFLHQIAPLKPADLYPSARWSSSHSLVMQEVGASAVAARVAIHAAATEKATEIGQMAAEYTGGTYNLSLADLSKTLDAVRNRCECLYRLGIEPLEKEKGSLGTVTVKVGDRSIANLRVQIFSGADHWLRQARRVLHNPGGARDLPVHAVILPVSSSSKGWSVKIQVALHASALTRLPTSRGSKAQWEAGALLAMDGGRRSWEMLAVSSMNAPDGAAAPEWFVHEKTLTALPPGSYRLRVFVRDRSVDLFGGASSELVLPDPAAVAAIGPITLLAERRTLTSDLPLQPVSRDAASHGRSQPASLVAAGDAVKDDEAGPPFEIMTWLCGVSPSSHPAAERYLSFEGSVVMTFPAETQWAAAGTCLRLTDRVEAGLLDDWPYQYHLRLNARAGAEPVVVEAALP